MTERERDRERLFNGSVDTKYATTELIEADRVRKWKRENEVSKGDVGEKTETEIVSGYLIVREKERARGWITRCRKQNHRAIERHTGEVECVMSNEEIKLYIEKGGESEKKKECVCIKERERERETETETGCKKESRRVKERRAIN